MSVEELLTLEDDKDLEQSQAEESGESVEESSPPEDASADSQETTEEQDEYAAIEDARELKRILREKAKAERGILAAKADEVRKRQQMQQQIAHYQGQLASVRQMIEMAQRQQQGQQPGQPMQQQTLQQRLDALDIPIEFDDDGNPKAKLSIEQLQGLLQEQLKPITQTHQRLAQQAEMQRRQAQMRESFQRFLQENPERAEAIKVYEEAKGFLDAKIEDFISKSGYPREHVIKAFRERPGKFHEFLEKSGLEREFVNKYKFPVENVLEYSGVQVDPYRRLDAMLRIARQYTGQQSSNIKNENKQFVQSMQRKPNNLLGAGGGKVGSRDKYDLADQISVHDLYGLPREKINQIKKALSAPD